jgi:branched-chain amino acid transport system ATP-binding protein
MAAMLEVKDISCGYDGAPVIRGLSLEVQEGEIVAIIGANGAGKTTTMRTICGLMHPEKGQILFRGEDITHSPASENIRKGISYIPEGRRLFPRLSVQENLELGAFTISDKSLIGGRLEEMFTLFPKLRDRRSQIAETLSGGEQQMCAIARGLMSSPKLILLDELSLGLMPSLVEKVFETVSLINRQGITVLIVEQMVQEALEIADRGYVLQTGRVVHSGTAGELLGSSEVRKAYMGL